MYRSESESSCVRKRCWSRDKLRSNQPKLDYQPASPSLASTRENWVSDALGGYTPKLEKETKASYSLDVWNPRNLPEILDPCQRRHTFQKSRSRNEIHETKIDLDLMMVRALHAELHCFTTSQSPTSDSIGRTQTDTKNTGCSKEKSPLPRFDSRRPKADMDCEVSMQCPQEHTERTRNREQSLL